MDKKKTIARLILLALVALMPHISITAQDEVDEIEFCGRSYREAPGSDSITLFLKLKKDGERVQKISKKKIKEYLEIREDGKGIDLEDATLEPLKGKGRIPEDYTISVLIDQNMPENAKNDISEAVGKLVETAAEGTVFVSFFGDVVTSSEMVTTDDLNARAFKRKLEKQSDKSHIYDAVYAKLVEFSSDTQEYEGKMLRDDGYEKNPEIAERAEENPNKNLMFIFLQGMEPGKVGEVTPLNINNYREETENVIPRIYAFYYTEDGNVNREVGQMLNVITRPKGESKALAGKFFHSNRMDDIYEEFDQTVEDAKYDYAITYKVAEEKSYSGAYKFSVLWDSEPMDEATYSIGTEEKPWPVRLESVASTMMKFVYAILVTLLTIAFFFFVMKVLVPAIKSWFFAAKYYKPYKPEPGVNKRICYYCRKELVPGEKVVTKCKHIMHVRCWKDCGYHCAEFGQNCNTGTQEHVDWQNMFTTASLRDFRQAFAGILAGLAAWLVYEMLGGGMFKSFAASMAALFLETEEKRETLLEVTTEKLSAFFTIGLFLALFLSLAFRYLDEYRNKDMIVIMKIAGLSLFTAVIGLLAFIVGGVLLCMILSSADLTYIPWYCSLPAYLLFSVCTTMSLTVKSSIPVKSAMIGGLCSAVIGFLVLYFSEMASDTYKMLLNFIVYGGGLGASLVTVRMLAEKYFLVITNGPKQGIRIPIHKWMNATGGGQSVAIGMSGDCEIQMNWDKSNRVAKEHAQLYIDHTRSVPVIKPMETGVNYNSRAELPKMKAAILTNGDTFQIGDTIFRYEEND